MKSYIYMLTLYLELAVLFKPSWTGTHWHGKSICGQSAYQGKNQGKHLFWIIPPSLPPPAHVDTFLPNHHNTVFIFHKSAIKHPKLLLYFDSYSNKVCINVNDISSLVSTVFAKTSNFYIAHKHANIYYLLKIFVKPISLILFHFLFWYTVRARKLWDRMSTFKLYFYLINAFFTFFRNYLLCNNIKCTHLVSDCITAHMI